MSEVYRNIGKIGEWRVINVTKQPLESGKNNTGTQSTSSKILIKVNTPLIKSKDNT